ncbi:MAG: redox-regulated ATPase YchF [Fimbriimonadaceae bacterium]|nr:redox-regulated ATPase YchF [Fimbriimonadaceae bacterium]
MDANALEVYLIGPAQSGKTTAFEALVGDREVGHRRVVKVPDPRVDRLFEIFQPAKKVFAEIIFCDIFAQKATELAGRHADRFTAALGTADMLAMVVSCFSDPELAALQPDPVAALDEVLLELVVADHSVVAKRLHKIDVDLKRGKKELLPEQAVLQKGLVLLEQEQPLSRLTLDVEEERLLRGFQFLTRKPALVLANIDEAGLGQPAPAALVAHAASRGFETLAFCAQVEAEIAGLEPAEQAAFLADYGIAEPVRERAIRTCYQSLDLIAFLTGGGPTEVRAWPIPRGCSAQEAAGTIHSDLARGFIRAETVAFADLDRLGNLAACREAGLLRLEGKEYPVADGDVITFRFNV